MATAADYPIALTSLTPREAVTDALYRAVTAFDLNDFSLFESAWDVHGEGKGEACIFEMNGNVSEGIQAIRDNVFTAVGPLDTTHFISNVRVDLRPRDGETETAYMTAYALAQHYRQGEGIDPTAEGHLMSGSMYFIDLVKGQGQGEEGLWRIKKWRMKIVWLDGDMGIVTK